MSRDPVALVRDALERHDCAPRGSGGHFTARCPAHDDRSPSLSISTGSDGRVLVHCFAGCATEDVLAELELCLGDLFPDDHDFDLRTTAATIGPGRDGDLPTSNGNGRARPAGGRRLALTTIADVQAEPVRWLWRGRVVLGMLNVTVGEPGLGKSTLAYDIPASLTRGELDGDLHGRPSDVLVVTYEDHIASVVRPRLEAAHADLSRVHEIGITQDDDSKGLVTLPNDIELIRQGIEQTRARLLIVDPIVASMPGEINSHRDQDVRRVLAPLAQLGERYDVAINAVMHVNKSQAKAFFQRVGGSVGFTGAARSMLLVARDPDDPDGERGRRRVLAHGKCNVGPLAPSLLFEIDTVGLRSGIETSRLDFLGECESTTADLLGGDNGDQRLAIDDAREFLEAELADGPRLADEITKAAAAGSISEMTLRRARKALGVRSKKQGFGAEGRWFWEMDLRRSTASGANPVITYAEIPISRDKALPD